MAAHMELFRRGPFGNVTHFAVLESTNRINANAPGRIYTLTGRAMAVRILTAVEMLNTFTVSEIQRRTAEGLVGSFSDGHLRLRHDVLQRLKKDISEIKTVNPQIDKGSIKLASTDTATTAAVEGEEAVESAGVTETPIEAPAAELDLSAIEEMTLDEAAIFEELVNELLERLVGNVEKKVEEEEDKDRKKINTSSQARTTTTEVASRQRTTQGSSTKTNKSSESHYEQERRLDENAAEEKDAKKDREQQVQQFKQDMRSNLEGIIEKGKQNKKKRNKEEI